jgi:hypothetical protein
MTLRKAWAEDLASKIILREALVVKATMLPYALFPGVSGGRPISLAWGRAGRPTKLKLAD